MSLAKGQKDAHPSGGLLAPLTLVSPAAMAVVREEMESVVALRVPLRVDIRAGLSWAEAH